MKNKPLPVPIGCWLLYLRTKNSILRLVGLIFLMVIAASCFDEGDCLITNSNIIRVSLRRFENKQSAASIHFTSVSIPGDTVLYQNVTLSALDLPVDPGQNTMQYVLEYGAKNDTLTFHYNNLTIVLSPTCGAFPYQRDLEITESTIGKDSVVVVNRSLVRNVAENARIYF